MNFYLHIGLPKTGTKFLQKNVFPELPEIKFLGRMLGGSFVTENLWELRKKIIFCTDQEFSMFLDSEWKFENYFGAGNVDYVWSDEAIIDAAANGLDRTIIQDVIKRFQILLPVNYSLHVIWVSRETASHTVSFLNQSLANLAGRYGLGSQRIRNLSEFEWHRIGYLFECIHSKKVRELLKTMSESLGFTVTELKYEKLERNPKEFYFDFLTALGFDERQTGTIAVDFQALPRLHASYERTNWVDEINITKWNSSSLLKAERYYLKVRTIVKKIANSRRRLDERDCRRIIQFIQRES